MPEEKDLDADEVRLEIRSAVERIRKKFSEAGQAEAAAGSEAADAGDKAEGESA
jgi:hypothetical protein